MPKWISSTYIYWAEGDGGAIGRADLDGTHVRPTFIRKGNGVIRSV